MFGGSSADSCPCLRSCGICSIGRGHKSLGVGGAWPPRGAHRKGGATLGGVKESWLCQRRRGFPGAIARPDVAAQATPRNASASEHTSPSVARAMAGRFRLLVARCIGCTYPRRNWRLASRAPIPTRESAQPVHCAMQSPNPSYPWPPAAGEETGRLGLPGWRLGYVLGHNFLCWRTFVGALAHMRASGNIVGRLVLGVPPFVRSSWFSMSGFHSGSFLRLLPCILHLRNAPRSCIVEARRGA